MGNGRHRKKLIHSHELEEGMIVWHEQLKTYTTNYYKNPFEALEEGNFSMDESRTDDIPQVSVEVNNLLTARYSKDEVKKAVFQMVHNKAPGLDGFPAEFY